MRVVAFFIKFLKRSIATIFKKIGGGVNYFLLATISYAMV